MFRQTRVIDFCRNQQPVYRSRSGILNRTLLPRASRNREDFILIFAGPALSRHLPQHRINADPVRPELREKTLDRTMMPPLGAQQNDPSEVDRPRGGRPLAAVALNAIVFLGILATAAALLLHGLGATALAGGATFVAGCFRAWIKAASGDSVRKTRQEQ